MKLLNIAILLLILVTVTLAQKDYLYENISVAEGLSSARFNLDGTIYQDRFGFLWFGTVDGLNRFDGYTFKVYKNIPGDSLSLPSNNVCVITEDAEGNLWIGTPSQMSRMDRKTNTFNTFPIDITGLPGTFNMSHSLIDSKGNLWIATQGQSIQKWNKSTRKFEAIPFLLELAGVDTLVANKNVPTFGLVELKNGNILASSYTNGIFFYNQNNNSFDKFNFATNYKAEGIVALMEDRAGKIWFSGKNTIAVYNPLTFTVDVMDGWKDDISTSEDIHFFGLQEDEEGSILFAGIPYGIGSYDPSEGKFEKIKIRSDLEQRGIGTFPLSFYKDNFGVYWVGLADNGILKFDPKRRPFRSYPFEDEKTNQSQLSFASDIKLSKKNPNEVFIASNRKGIFSFDILSKQMRNLDIRDAFIYSDSSNVSTIVVDDSDMIWYSSKSTYLSSYNQITKKVNSYNMGNKKLLTGNLRILDMEYIPQDKIIVSSPLGVQVFNTQTGIIENLPSIANRTYDDLILKQVRDIVRDTEAAAALLKIGEAANETKTFKVNEESDFLIVCLGEGQYPGKTLFDYGILSDKEGNVLWQMDSTVNTFHAGGGIKNRIQIETLNLKPGDYYLKFGTDVGHSYGNFNVIPPNDSTWYGIQAIPIDRSTANDLKTKLQKETKTKRFPDFFFSDVVISSKKYPNTIWFGAGERGIVHYDLTSGKFNQYLLTEIEHSTATISGLFEDSKGILWIVVNPSGFYRFDPETKKFISNASIPDLPQTTINSSVEDFQGNLWISSGGGITKLFKNSIAEEDWSITNFDSRDGLPGGFGSGALITASSEILLGSFNGIIAFYPSSENNTPPIPVISDIKISDVSVLEKKSSFDLEESIFDLTELDLAYAQNDISFEFASIHYSRPSKNRVSYKLEGFNSDWIFTDKNFASFTNLEPGEYEFSVRAFSGYGISSPSTRSIKIIVDPPWYRTTAAYISYVLLFAGIIFGLDRFQRHRLLGKERERQRIQEAELRAVAAEAQSKLMQAENERKTKELEEARNLQLSMLPRELPNIPNLDIAVYMKTASEVGGDYYDFHVGLDGTLTVVLGDATGHGMKAGTMVTAVKSLFRSYGPHPDIIHSFHEITRCLKEINLEKLSMCMTMLKIQGGNMSMSAAGMPPILLFRNGDKSIEEHVMKGMPLGTIEKFPYEIRETNLNIGDTVLLMSDGFPELMNKSKDIYGYKKARYSFEEVADKNPEEIIAHLKDEGSRWRDDEDPDDDVTFVVIKIKG